MACAGLYKTEVQKDVTASLHRANTPSMDAVRVALGNRGSKSTIHRYLKELEAEAATPGLSGVVISDALRNLVGQLSARLAEEADNDASSEFTDVTGALIDSTSPASLFVIASSSTSK
jgi:hypothetical protein